LAAVGRLDYDAALRALLMFAARKRIWLNCRE